MNYDEYSYEYFDDGGYKRSGKDLLTKKHGYTDRYL
jgi:hypothetical protein